MPLQSWRVRPTSEKSAPPPPEALEPLPVDLSTMAHPERESSTRPRPPIVRYVGFTTTADGREYTCRVNDGLGQRQFVLFIAHRAFAAREARFQDAPDLCCARLQRELAADPDLVPGSRLSLTAEELLDYRNVREHRAPGRRRGAAPG